MAAIMLGTITGKIRYLAFIFFRYLITPVLNTQKMNVGESVLFSLSYLLMTPFLPKSDKGATGAKTAGGSSI